MKPQQALDRLFNPASVAVIGASEVPGKASERRVRSLLEGGYPGQVYLVNPKRDTLFGLKAYPSMNDVDGPVDLAMIVIPGRFIPRAVADAAAKGAKGVIIITAGLGETGSEGKAIEADILAAAAQGGVNVIGPNCSGMYSASGTMNFLGIPGIRPGRLSVLAQSGNIIDSLTHFAARRGRGFSRIISSGNAVGVHFHDYIDYLADDDDTDAIMLYLESIKDGAELIASARRAVAKKPIIALKVGRTGAGQRASASHTGALAANDAIVEAAFEQAGIIRVSNVDEMFDLAETLVDCPPAKGRRVAILSEGGGDNSVAADNAERWGLEVPVLSRATQERIIPHLLSGMPAHNPIDYGGTAEENPAVVATCVREVMASGEVDMIYLTGFFGGFQDIIAGHVGPEEAKAAGDMADAVAQTGISVVVNTSFAEADYEAIRLLKERRIPVFESSDRAAQALSVLARQADNAGRMAAGEPVTGRGADRPGTRRIIDAALASGRLNLLETESRAVLAEYDIPLPPAGLAADAGAAVDLAREMAGPVALKIVSPDIIHKSDVGGVALDLAGDEEVRTGAEKVLAGARKVAGPDRIEGLLVSPMAGPGQEIIVGLIRDPQFGPVVMFGLGGVFVEVLRDVSFGVAPLTGDDVTRMIETIKGRRMLDGVRGRPASDVAAIAELITGLSIIGLENPEIAEMDLNPVIVHDRGLSVVDSRMILARDQGSGDGGA